VTPSVFIKAPEKSIAVLPFDNISSNKEDAYFADGVQDEILNNLAKIAELKVISRTSVMKYRAVTERDLRQIATVLGVANVLEGTVRREGNRVRVSTELVDARNDTTIWADSYDRDLTDIFAIQSEIAQQVASKLSAQLSPQEQKDIEEKSTDNLEAYDLYLRAKEMMEADYWTDWPDTASSDLEISSKIVSLLQEAIQKDGKFALPYCLMAKVHDALYLDGTDHTPERRALGDAALNEALRLRPDLPEVHLASALHLYCCYRDFERARVQIAIAAQARPNNAEVLELTASIDRVQGRWEKSTTGLEKATTLDPRSVTILSSLGGNYESLRRYRDQMRILDRLIELEPNKPTLALSKALLTFLWKADVKGVRAAFEAVPSSIKDGKWVRSTRIYLAICSRDFPAAEAIISQDPTEELDFVTGSSVPPQIYALLVEFLEGKHPTTEEFGAAREQLYRKVREIPESPFLMEVLAYADASLGRKEDAMEEGRRAMEMRPISEDAEFGPGIAADIAMMYAMLNESESAFEQLAIVIKMPGVSLNYGDLKTDPGWDTLRKDPRFDKLLAELAPGD
jgi:serine/threonine-protein kinase